MAIRLLRGPPGGGKSQWLKENAEGDIHLDTTTIWAAIMGLERDPDGLFRERLEDETGLRMAQYPQMDRPPVCGPGGSGRVVHDCQFLTGSHRAG